MLVVGGEINTGISGIPEIFDRKDESSLIRLAEKQIELGADMLGINLGGRSEEKKELAWAAELIQSHCSVPLAFDTPDLEIFEEGLKVHRNDWGFPLLNSTTAESERLKSTCRLVAKHNLPFVALPTNGVGYSVTSDEMLKHVETIVREVESHSIPLSNLHIDPMLSPISIVGAAGQVFLESLRDLKREFPEIKTICGIDNISHGLPGRSLLSSFFLSMAMAEGLSAVILKSNRLHYAALRGGEALLGRDLYCSSYIESWRTGVWDDLIEEECLQ